MSDDTYARIRPLIAQAVQNAAVTDALNIDSSLRQDLGFDSVGIMTLALLLEEEFGIDVAANVHRFAEIETVAGLITFIDGLRQSDD